MKGECRDKQKTTFLCLAMLDYSLSYRKIVKVGAIGDVLTWFLVV